jgi:hypothetical protein
MGALSVPAGAPIQGTLLTRQWLAGHLGHPATRDRPAQQLLKRPELRRIRNTHRAMPEIILSHLFPRILPNSRPLSLKRQDRGTESGRNLGYPIYRHLGRRQSAESMYYRYRMARAMLGRWSLAEAAGQRAAAARSCFISGSWCNNAGIILAWAVVT